MLAEVTGFDLARARGRARPPANGDTDRARCRTTRWSSPAARATRTSATTSGQAHAPELKSLEGALDDPQPHPRARSRPPRSNATRERRRSWLTFVVVGAGPTGVEMAGQIAELARDTLRARLPLGRHAHGARAARRGGRPRARRASRRRSRAKAARSLEQLGVTPLRRPHRGRRRRRLGRDPDAATARSSRSPRAP